MTILPRVTIGNNEVAAVGTVVTKKLPDNCFVSGVLAKKIKDIENDRAAYGKQLLRYLSEKLTEEATKSGWSSRQLDRQIKSFYYQRILTSKDKNSVSAEIDTLEPKLEQALIDHLQKFLLELGRGYSFVARQKHFNVDGRHFYIDLVFYNYILKCFVLIGLKIGDF